MNDLADVRATHNAMAAAHERVMGFHLLEPLAQRQVDDSGSADRGRDERVHRAAQAAAGSDRTGVGHIPPLPRPNFLSAIAEFTLGE